LHNSWTWINESALMNIQILAPAHQQAPASSHLWQD
jgi:hypothetical protein